GGGGGVTWDLEALGAPGVPDGLAGGGGGDAPPVCATSLLWFCLLGSDRPECVLTHRYASPSSPLSCFVVELVVVVTSWLLLLLCR
nr:hypothetical protein [Tanacetum cinerariifolium]